MIILFKYIYIYIYLILGNLFYFKNLLNNQGFNKIYT